MRTFARLASVSALLLCAGLGHAQEINLAVSGSTLFSARNPTASLNYPLPPEKGGLYPGASFERIFKNGFGYNAEFSYRYKMQTYNAYQKVRPFLYDANAVMQRPLSKRFIGDFMAGVGGERLAFEVPFTNCNYGSGCPTHISDNHFLFHAGAGLRYHLWRSFYVRPEVHYYYIINNDIDFHSNNVLRVGASIGYTFHTD